ncbi:MAG TPA: hypothetical protein VKE70_37755 [Candidatus Solibacter sp.]|nr:hypothetical protein [Candidatus Solibacter sp.]
MVAGVTCWAHKAREAEYIEGPRAWQRFENAMVKALTLSKAELDERMAAQGLQSAMNSHKGK